MVATIIAAIAALLGFSVVGGLMGWLVPLATVLVLLAFTWLFISKAIDASAVSPNMVFPGILFVMGLGCALFALFVINPAIFEQTIPLSIAAEGVAAPPIDVNQLLATVPIEESAVGALNPMAENVLLLLGVIGSVLLFQKYREGK